jgi:hypothetical protein
MNVLSESLMLRSGHRFYLAHQSPQSIEKGLETFDAFCLRPSFFECDGQFYLQSIYHCQGFTNLLLKGRNLRFNFSHSSRNPLQSFCPSTQCIELNLRGFELGADPD